MPRGQRNDIREWLPRFATVASATLVAACTIVIPVGALPRPEVVYEPDIAGVVSEGDCDKVTGACTLTVSGQTFEIGPEARSLNGDDAPGGSDTVLIFGAEDGTSWFLNARIPSTGQLAGCAVLTNSDAWDTGDAIVYAFASDVEDPAVVGLRLPKAEEWDEDIDLDADDRYPASYNWWCLDLHGRVSAVYPGTGA